MKKPPEQEYRMASKATTTFTIQAEDKTKAGISSAQSSFKEFTSSIDSITGGMASKVANLVTNPWTAAIAVIGTGVKVTKELWTAGTLYSGAGRTGAADVKGRYRV